MGNCNRVLKFIPAVFNTTPKSLIGALQDIETILEYYGTNLKDIMDIARIIIEAYEDHILSEDERHRISVSIRNILRRIIQHAYEYLIRIRFVWRLPDADCTAILNHFKEVMREPRIEYIHTAATEARQDLEKRGGGDTSSLFAIFTRALEHGTLPAKLEYKFQCFAEDGKITLEEKQQLNESLMRCISYDALLFKSFADLANIFGCDVEAMVKRGDEVIEYIDELYLTAREFKL